ncbi:bifunctional phosphoribosylaminoimidazolecarboxamide formyltransferase/inosine monophosphate cyclohydrolase [Aestuariivirga litoralis]|uniref:Bifunctional purine biosynthesis protein PurH n=1 Tax=Aestuariivirga litoralis TaxID=2650924 RepID=A0A2W2AXQ9_9HYPH|nr:bifunctional phosphoribosylaminoimidazolecarboxamide formyltransferase/IMP cyclohydrolase [Aestuariivirga litoralis]PZF77420.1 bifunctional phosphoribosylaminoimidazolecarboxamide formyltransferase/inosine monophosphate cyclohydrolase [Aestuariivirga litoralis]
MTEPVRRALLSVSDKTGLISFATRLVSLGIELISTGGTARALTEAGLPVIEVSSVTGFPEIMDGRVKTLHPAIHGGLLGVRANADHNAAISEHGISPIGLLVVNLYPFEATVARGASWEDTIENIDVGGPAMIRAAAKNHDDVTVIIDPDDYELVAGELASGGNVTTLKTRRNLAAKAFARTASYDAAISQWFGTQSGETFGSYFATGGRRLQGLRYGENPHQQGAFYATPGQSFGIAAARQIQGKELSYNNINDTDAALECLSEFGNSEGAACVIVKHANPCGVAVGHNAVDAYRKALACDPVSAFGGIIALSRPLDADTAGEITELFTEVIIAPYADEKAVEIVARKKNLRLLLLDGKPMSGTGLAVKSVGGGLLVQTRDAMSIDGMDLRVVTKRQPTPAELADLRFAFRVAKHVKSNAIVYAKDGATVGIGAGQMSRVDSARIAARKNEDVSREAGLAHPSIRGSVVASDAFFPFPDGLLQAAEAGATAVIQPGGSMKDADVIRAADEKGLAMVFTGIRHFRH